jgi:penicillin amidase
MLKTLLKVFIIILVLSAGVLFVLFSPEYATELSFNGEVTAIRRDANNIPTITAPSRKGYLYALGRVHAEDRLFQMSFKLLVVQGRLSEYLGERPLPMDKFMREVNLYGWGLKMAERLKR